MKKERIIEIIAALLFTFCGGFCDAYTLTQRGGVYTNMQTGNLVKLCISISNGVFNFSFFLPIICFCFGIFFTVLFNKFKYYKHIVIGFLFGVSIISAFIPNNDNWGTLCVCLLSLSGAAQFEAFRKCATYTYTSTMCTNNMRLFAEASADFLKDKSNKKVFFYLAIILTFSLGAIVSALLCKALGLYTIALLSAIYLILYLLLLQKSWIIKQCINK